MRYYVSGMGWSGDINQDHPDIIQIVRYLGAFYLLYLGSKILYAP